MPLVRFSGDGLPYNSRGTSDTTCMCVWEGEEREKIIQPALPSSCPPPRVLCPRLQALRAAGVVRGREGVERLLERRVCLCVLPSIVTFKKVMIIEGVKKRKKKRGQGSQLHARFPPSLP